MTKFPKPFYRADRRLWYVQLDGKQIKLGPDREKAFERYHALMRRPVEHRVVAEVVDLIVDRFLDWCEKHRSPDTYEWYRSRLQLFVDRYPKLRVAELRPYHVQEWIDSYAHLSSGSKRNHCRSIQRALHWAEEQGLIERSPIAYMKKPRAGRREVVISPEVYQRILENVPNEQFRDLIMFALETGARAAECLAIERRHVDLQHFRIVFPPEEEKMRRAPRVIYLSEAAMEIVRRRLRLRFNNVFVNHRGRAWTTEAVNCGFNAIRHRMGKQAMQQRGVEISEKEISALLPKLRKTRCMHGKMVDKSNAALREEAKRKLTQRLAARLAPKYCLTAFRHSWCHPRAAARNRRAHCQCPDGPFRSEHGRIRAWSQGCIATCRTPPNISTTRQIERWDEDGSVLIRYLARLQPRYNPPFPMGKGCREQTWTFWSTTTTSWTFTGEKAFVMSPNAFSTRSAPTVSPVASA